MILTTKFIMFVIVLDAKYIEDRYHYTQGVNHHYIGQLNTDLLQSADNKHLGWLATQDFTIGRLPS